VGVQTGSSSKLFTLVAALDQGMPFGYTDTVPHSQTVTGFTSCAGSAAGNGPAGPGSWHVVNASPTDKGKFSLYTGTTQSINTFYAHLEKKVGLCTAVHAAVKMGVSWADGTPLLKPDNKQASADNTPSFTLGSVYVSPLSMAAAYATVAARGVYCKPVAIGKITTASGKSLPAPDAGCHRVMPANVADAVNYVLQGVLTQPGATASPPAGPGGIGRPAAGKTGTSDVSAGGGTPYAAFAGYTPGLAGYVSVFNPVSPTGNTMQGSTACYRDESGGQVCPTEMYGANAPAQTWHMTFDNAHITGPYDFTGLPRNSPFFSKGDGKTVIQPSANGGHHHHHGAPPGNGQGGQPGGGQGGSPGGGFPFPGGSPPAPGKPGPPHHHGGHG
jgi:membrane peptidoglycan carboxypeptidase